jgi:hypothetical protein
MNFICVSNNINFSKNCSALHPQSIPFATIGMYIMFYFLYIDLLSSDQGSLRTLLNKIWFTMFPRAGGRTAIGSSSFEHVFMGEIHRGEISGFHNWVFFNAEESAGRANYRGFTRYVDLGGVRLLTTEG